MAEERLRTEILVQAGFRYCDLNLLTAVLRRRGDPDAGALLVKVSRLDGLASLFARTYGHDGAIAWHRTTGEDWVAEADGEARLAREIGFDSDVWIVEVEDPKGLNPFQALTG